MTRLITEVYAHLGVYSLIGPPFRYHSKLVKLHKNFKKKCYNLICITGTEILLESVNIETGTVCFCFLYFFLWIGCNSIQCFTSKCIIYLFLLTSQTHS